MEMKEKILQRVKQKCIKASSKDIKLIDSFLASEIITVNGTFIGIPEESGVSELYFIINIQTGKKYAIMTDKIIAITDYKVETYKIGSAIKSYLLPDEYQITFTCKESEVDERGIIKL